MNEKISGLIAALTDFAENLNEKTLGSLVDEKDTGKSETGNQDWNQQVKKDQHDRDDRLAKQIAIELDKIITKPGEKTKAKSTQPKEGDTVLTGDGKAGKVTKPAPQSKKASAAKPQKTATATKSTDNIIATTQPVAKEKSQSRKIQSTVSSVAITDISKGAAKTFASMIPKDKIPPNPIKPKEESSWLKKLIVPVLLGIGGVLAMINGLMGDGTGEETGTMKILSKLGITGGLKMVAKLFGGPALKITGKLFGWVTKALRPVLKRIPVIGSLISWAFAWKRIKEGDYVGGLIDIASGIATMLPGIGTAIGIGLDILNAWLDYSETGQSIKEKSNFTMAAFAMKAVGWAAKFLKPVLKRIPVLGTAISFVSGWDRFKSGDIIGGVLDFVSGIATLIPGPGTIISMGIDMLQMWMDNSDTGQELKQSGSGFTLAAMGAKVIAFAAKFIKPVLKRIPLIGTALSFAAAWDKFKQGNVLGGAIDIASGIATMIPGPGTAISIGLDVLNMWLGDPGNPDSNAAKAGGKMSDLWDSIKSTGKKLLKGLGNSLLGVLPEWMRGKVASFLGLEHDGESYDSEEAFAKAQAAAVESQTKSLEKTGLDTAAIKDITSAAVKAADKAGGDEFYDRTVAIEDLVRDSEGSMRKFKQNMSADQKKNIETYAKKMGTTYDSVVAQLAASYKDEWGTNNIDKSKRGLVNSIAQTATGYQLAREKNEAAINSLTENFKSVGVTLGDANLKLDKAGKIDPNVKLNKSMFKEIERLEKSTDEADQWYMQALERAGVMDKIRAERASAFEKAEYDPTISESNPMGKRTPTSELLGSSEANDLLGPSEPDKLLGKRTPTNELLGSSEANDVLGSSDSGNILGSSDRARASKFRSSSDRFGRGTYNSRATQKEWDRNPPLSQSDFNIMRKSSSKSESTQTNRITGGGSTTRISTKPTYKSADPIKPIQPTVGPKFEVDNEKPKSGLIPESQFNRIMDRRAATNKQDKIAAMSLDRQLMIESQNLHKAESLADLSKADEEAAKNLLSIYDGTGTENERNKAITEINLLMKANIKKGYTDFQPEVKPIPDFGQTPDAFDFIWRPGQEPMTFSKGDIIIGAHQDNMPAAGPPLPPSDQELLTKVDKMVEIMSEHSSIHTKVLEVLTESGLIDKQGDTVVNNGGNTNVVNNMVADNTIMDFRDRVVGRLTSNPNKY